MYDSLFVISIYPQSKLLYTPNTRGVYRQIYILYNLLSDPTQT
jgi:hypothetical protein